MQTDLRIEFDGLAPSDAVSARIWKHMEHLEKLFPRITDGRVVVVLAHHHHRKGNIFHIRIELNVPGKRLVVAREPGEDHAHADVYVALRDAFHSMQRIVQEYARKNRGEIKFHESPQLEGRVSRVLSYDGYGFIITPDDREIYFDANALVDGKFSTLAVGTRVRFCEEMGEEGPQASTVYCS